MNPNHRDNREVTMSHPSLPGIQVPDFQRVHLQRLKLAADVILSEAPDLPAGLETELHLYRELIECALLEPTSATAAR
jgi:hypothetical protein